MISRLQPSEPPSSDALDGIVERRRRVRRTESGGAVKVRHLSWSNYRRLPNGQIDIRDHLVLVGPNDTGKSSIVRALHLCLGMAHGQATSAITARDFTYETEPIVITVTLDGIDDDDRAAFPDEITIGPPEVLVIQLRAELDPADSDQKTVWRTFPDSGHSRAPTKGQLKAIGFEYVPAARSLLRELGAGSGGAVRSLLSGLDLAADAAAFQAAADQYRAALAGSTALGDFRRELAQSLTSGLPVAIPEDDVRVVSEAEALDDPLSGVVVTIREDGRDIPLAEQSDGVRALSVLTLLSMSHKAAKIIAVDEPETHLHPTAQRSISSTLRAAPGQRILVSHSPAVVREMSPMDVVAFRADRHPRQLGPGAAIVAEEATVRHWTSNLIEPLTARRVIVLEGVADRILVERAAELGGMNLNRLGIAVLELGGSGLFRVACQLLGPAGFDVPVFGLLDEDARVEWASILGLDPADLEGAGYHVCAPDLEGLYIDTLGVPAVIGMLLASPLITEASILASCGVANVGDVTRDRLLTYCGHKKHKVAAALAVSAGISGAGAAALGPIAALLGLATA